MVKIRYAGRERYGAPAYGIIQTAIERTSVKFDNNIVSNRFEQVNSHYEVTIKCRTSHGAGAKRGASGRLTRSACWHAWDTFFDELFKLNPAIVIIAQGKRITKDSGNWDDRLVGLGLHESEMCNCVANGWEDRAVDDMIVERAQTPVVETPVERRCATCRHSILNGSGVCNQDCNGSSNPGWEEYIHAPVVEESQRLGECDETCRHSRRNNNGTPCSRNCIGHLNPGWEPYIPPVVEQTGRRHCVTCRHSITHNPGVYCSQVASCGERGAGFPLWEEHIITPSCGACKHSIVNTSIFCPMFHTECLNFNKFEPFVKPTAPIQPPQDCSTCAYSNQHRPADSNGGCYAIVGRCGIGIPKYKRWVDPNDTVGFDPEKYVQEPQVMPETKEHQSEFMGVI